MRLQKVRFGFGYFYQRISKKEDVLKKLEQLGASV